MAAVVLRIDAFDKRCEKEQYTDTGDAWALLNWIRHQLRDTRDESILDGARVMWNNVTLGEVPATIIKVRKRYKILLDVAGKGGAWREAPTWVDRRRVRVMTDEERAKYTAADGAT